MTALAQALVRAGVVNPDDVPRARVGEPRVQHKARLLQELQTIEAMTDIDLQLELVALDENIAMIKTDLGAEYDQATDRGPGWQVSAEKALAALKARHSLCQGETNRRRKAAEAERHAAVTAERAAERAAAAAAIEAKAATQREVSRAASERRAAEAARRSSRDAAFVRVAHDLSPRETTAAIWDAVAAEARG